MFNVYPKRDTVFDELDEYVNDCEHIRNLEIINKTIAEYSQIDIWAAFGNHIYDRKYLPICFKDIYSKLPKENITWYATAVNKSGAPKHPLYQKNTAQLNVFDMEAYIETLV